MFSSVSFETFLAPGVHSKQKFSTLVTPINLSVIVCVHAQDLSKDPIAQALGFFNARKSIQ